MLIFYQAKGSNGDVRVLRSLVAFIPPLT